MLLIANFFNLFVNCIDSFDIFLIALVEASIKELILPFASFIAIFGEILDVIMVTFWRLSVYIFLIY